MSKREGANAEEDVYDKKSGASMLKVFEELEEKPTKPIPFYTKTAKMHLHPNLFIEMNKKDYPNKIAVGASFAPSFKTDCVDEDEEDG